MRTAARAATHFRHSARRSIGSAAKESIFIQQPVLTFSVLGSSTCVAIGAYKLSEQNRRSKESFDAVLSRLNASEAIEQRFGSPVRLVGAVRPSDADDGSSNAAGFTDAKAKSFFSTIMKAPKESFDVIFGTRQAYEVPEPVTIKFAFNGPKLAGGDATVSTLGTSITAITVEVPGSATLELVSAEERAEVEAALEAIAAAARAKAAPIKRVPRRVPAVVAGEGDDASSSLSAEAEAEAASSSHTWRSLGLTAIVGATIGIAASLYWNRYRKTVGPWQAVELATGLVKASPAANRMLGAPINAGAVDFRGSKLEPHFAQFAFSVTGSLDRPAGELLGNAILEGEEWRFTHLSLQVPGHKKVALQSESEGGGEEGGADAARTKKTRQMKKTKRRRRKK